MAPPREEIRAADEIGAENNPQAALHLKYARDEIANADKLLADGDQRSAQLALMRAESDAKLALELTRGEKARGQAEEAQRKIADLQQKTQTPAAMP